MAKIELSEKIDEDKISIGDFFFNEESGEIFIVSCYGGKYFLSCLNDGCIWCDPRSEIEDIFSDSRKHFVKITTPFTVTP